MRSYNSRLMKQPAISLKLANPSEILKFRNFFGVAATALLVSVALFISDCSWAQNYYVDATNGSDSWQGTLPDAQGANGPWKTLSKVNQTYFAPGDSVLLKCGQTWNETLVVTSSGVDGSPITYGAFGSCNGTNKPVIDGSTPVNGWTAIGGGIYKALVPLEVGTINQVFLDNQYQSLAHYPNRGFISGRPSNMFLAINNSCSKGPTTSLTAGSDLAITAAQQADLKGAGIHFRSNAWTIEDRTINEFDTNTRTFNLATNSEYEICKDWGYYLNNKLWMLDKAGEWYYDTAVRQLYVMPVTGTPEDRVVASHRVYGVFANARTYVVIDGLSIRKTMTGISAQNGSSLIIRNTDVADSGNTAILYITILTVKLSAAISPTAYLMASGWAHEIV